MDLKKLSNNELKLILLEYENEYESLKSDIQKKITRMEVLDKKYKEINDIFMQRTKGKITVL